MPLFSKETMAIDAPGIDWHFLHLPHGDMGTVSEV